MTTPRLPGPQSRLVVIGSTGTGKTVAGLWHLSNADLLDRPWVIFDFKGDENIAELAARELSLSETPKRPGLYVYRPIPELHDAAVKAALWRMWKQENIGMFADEGTMLGDYRNAALNACLTQGRSKNIQMIVCTQRPTRLSRYIFSEAGYFQVFRLNDGRDYEPTKEMTGLDFSRRLPPYHSYYYDVAANSCIVMAPVPKRGELIDKINSRLKSRMRTI